MLLGNTDRQEEKRDRIQISNTRNKRDITTNLKDIKIKDITSSFMSINLVTQEEMGKFFEKHNYENWYKKKYFKKNSITKPFFKTLSPDGFSR